MTACGTTVYCISTQMCEKRFILQRSLGLEVLLSLVIMQPLNLIERNVAIIPSSLIGCAVIRVNVTISPTVNSSVGADYKELRKQLFSSHYRMSIN